MNAPPVAAPGASALPIGPGGMTALGAPPARPDGGAFAGGFAGVFAEAFGLALQGAGAAPCGPLGIAPETDAIAPVGQGNAPAMSEPVAVLVQPEPDASPRETFPTGEATPELAPRAMVNAMDRVLRTILDGIEAEDPAPTSSEEGIVDATPVIHGKPEAKRERQEADPASARDSREIPPALVEQADWTGGTAAIVVVQEIPSRRGAPQMPDRPIAENEMETGRERPAVQNRRGHDQAHMARPVGHQQARRIPAWTQASAEDGGGDLDIAADSSLFRDVARPARNLGSPGGSELVAHTAAETREGNLAAVSLPEGWSVEMAATDLRPAATFGTGRGIASRRASIVETVETSAAIPPEGSAAPQTPMATGRESATAMAYSPDVGRVNGGHPTGATPSQIPLPSDAVARAEHVLGLQDARDMQPVSHVMLRFDNPGGGEDRVRIALRGNTVGATIHLQDAAAAGPLSQRLPELVRALEERGLETAEMHVRTSAAADTSVVSEATRIAVDSLTVRRGTLASEPGPRPSRSSDTSPDQGSDHNSFRHRSRKEPKEGKP